ncbi:DoxX family membrane protein [Candidatus Poribacteria bacterium]|nr:DoxX family membrane protein [Candidatus Poribacteria bacterium]
MNAVPGCHACRKVASLALLCRVVAGGAFLLASYAKLQDPRAFMLAIESFQFPFLPRDVIPVFAYALPWMELVCGVLLVLGAWTRAAAIIAAGLYLAFTGALASVILRGLPVDCGCFGGILGSGTVDWTSILRNSVFIVASGVLIWRQGGAWSLEAKPWKPAACPLPSVPVAAAEAD